MYSCQLVNLAQHQVWKIGKQLVWLCQTLLNPEGMDKVQNEHAHGCQISLGLQHMLIVIIDCLLFA